MGNIRYALPELHDFMDEFNCYDFMLLPPHETPSMITVIAELMNVSECINSVNIKCIIEQNYTSKPHWFSMTNDSDTGDSIYICYKPISHGYNIVYSYFAKNIISNSSKY